MTDIDNKRNLIADAATSLLSAYRTRKPVAPVRDVVPGLTIADAYDIQKAQIGELSEKWGPIIGRKVGLTSLAMQKQLGVDSPDFGFFTEGQLYGDNELIPVEQFIAPKVEPEFAFLITQDLSGGNVTAKHVAQAIGSVHAAIEIIDSRIANWDITLPDTIADNASCGAVAIGAKALDVDVNELNDIKCGLKINDELVDEGVGSDVLGNPLEAVAWLANILHEQGDKLSAGEWVLPGSFTAAAPVHSGTQATADFGELGSLTIKF